MTRKGRQLDTSHEDVKADENYGLDFGVGSEKGSHTRRTTVETKPASCSGKPKRKFKVCVFSLFLSTWHVVSLCPANAGDSVFILCFFLPDGYLKSVVLNKLLCLWTKTEFCVFVNFSNSEVTTGSPNHLRRSDTRINPFTTWWYIYIYIYIVSRLHWWYLCSQQKLFLLFFSIKKVWFRTFSKKIAVFF